MIFPNWRRSVPGEGFPDHEQPRVLHVLPRVLTAAREADGTPRFALSRFRDTAIDAAGGLMHLELDLATLDPELLGAAAADGWVLRLVGFIAARARLRSHVPGFPDVDLPDAWKPARLSSRTLMVEKHLFDAHTAQMLDALLSSDAGDIEVEVEARYEGLEEPMPVLVSADLHEIAALLRLEGEGATGDQIEAAMLSAPTGNGSPFRLERLEGERLADGPALRRLLALAIRGDILAALTRRRCLGNPALSVAWRYSRAGPPLLGPLRLSPQHPDLAGALVPAQLHQRAGSCRACGPVSGIFSNRPVLGRTGHVDCSGWA